MPSFIIENIDFDFSDAEESLTQEKKDFITENAKGVWYVDREDDLNDFVSEVTGYPVDGMLYCPNQPHALAAYL